MKKISILLIGSLLFGCSVNDEDKPIKSSHQKATDQSYHFVNGMTGASTSKGYYRLVTTDNEEGTTITNLHYYDYASKKEIILCDKPECKHDNKNCAAYVEDGLMAKIFANKEYLYFIQKTITNSDNDSGGAMISTSGGGIASIYRTDLDGKNRKKICSLKEGYEFDSIMFVGENFLYIPIHREEYIATSDNSSMGVTTEQYLVRIDLNSGKQKKILNMKDMYLQNGVGTTAFLQKIYYDRDPQELLNNQDYEGYDQVMKSGKSKYMTYDVTKEKLGNEVSIGNNVPVFDGNQLYYINDRNELIKQSMQGGDPELLSTLTGGQSYNLEYLDQHLMIQAWQDVRLNAAYLSSYVYSLKDKTLKVSPMSTSDPKEPLNILGSNEDMYFLMYDRTGHMENTWAGTEQFTTDQEFFGQIKKDDYWNGIKNFIKFTTLGE